MPVLTTILCGALLVALALNVAPFLEGNSTWGRRFGVDSWSPDKPFLHIPSLVLSTGSLLALMTFVRERKKMQVDRAWSRSEVVLREAKAGLDEVLGLLRNQNNDRVIWVRAARSLVEAQRLGTRVEPSELREAYQLYAHRIRNELYLALTVEDAASGKRQPLPAQFFYGTDDWRAMKPLDRVAVEVSAPLKAYTVSLDELPPGPTLLRLSRSSVVSVLDFLDYPKEYEDPLKEVELWDDNWGDQTGAKAGAARYLAHRAAKYAIGGQLFDRGDDKSAIGPPSP